MDNLIIKGDLLIRKFSEVDLNDKFFDSLKADYTKFEEWFEKKRKAGEVAYVQYDIKNSLSAFLYMKDESGVELCDVNPTRPACRRLKVSTFKIDPHKTRLGERFVKKILDRGIESDYEEIYVTIFSKHKSLINLLGKFGFVDVGEKNGERVLVKSLKTITGEILKDYPLVSTKGKRKYLLSIYPKYHTQLFPDSILRNEEKDRYDLIKDVSHTNGIHKIYISFIQDTARLKKGDLIVIYRTNDYKGSARYRSVVTSVCQVEDVMTKSAFPTAEALISYAKEYSIFTPDELRGWFAGQKNLVVIKMTYNIAFTKRVTRAVLLDEIGIPSNNYFGFFELTDSQFKAILEKGDINENLIID